MTIEKVKIEVELPSVFVELLAALVPPTSKDDDGLDLAERCSAAIVQLCDHAQQGVYRPGAWERRWLMQAFGDEFLGRLEVGDPYGRSFGERCPFNRPLTREEITERENDAVDHEYDDEPPLREDEF